MLGMLKSHPMLSSFRKLVPEPIKYIYHTAQALTGALIFLFPSKRLKIIGVTGTDGKTTTVQLIHHILGESGKKVSMLSTVNAKIGDKVLDTGLHVTTPDPFKVQALLNKMVKAGSEYVVLETTSHGLAQGRVAFVDFLVGVITNVTHEHIDYHHSFDNYVNAKAKILNGVSYRILNYDDPSFGFLKERGTGQLVSFGLKEGADYRAQISNSGRGKLEIELTYPDKKKKASVGIKTNLFGSYNAYNILSAFIVCHLLSTEPKKITSLVATFSGVPGRMQFIDEGQNFDCVVDFAHTPASLKVALESLNKIKKGKIIAVFGSAGERDVEKRPAMGKIATELADYSIFTAEDPRGEDVNKIIDQISKGAESIGGIPNRTFWKIANREEAINTAVQSLASGGDIVAIFGKGHEMSMNIKGREYPWSDEQVARSAIKTKLAKIKA